MTKSLRVVVALAIATGTAVAQPGATPPDERPPPSADNPAGVPDPAAGPPGMTASGTVQGDGSVNLDDVIARVQAASPTIENVVRGTLRRARRALSIGPTAGYWVGPVMKQDTHEQAITVGIGAELFKVPVMPSFETLQALVAERAKAKVKEQIAARALNREQVRSDIEQLARDAWEEAVSEILGLANVRPKLMERPRLSLGLEVNRLVTSDGWMPRFRLGFGVWKLTLAGAFGVSTVDNTPVYGGIEVIAHFLPSKDPRADVLDVFVRADWQLRDSAGAGDIVAFGARYMLDLF